MCGLTDSPGVAPIAITDRVRAITTVPVIDDTFVEHSIVSVCLEPNIQHCWSSAHYSLDSVSSHHYV